MRSHEALEQERVIAWARMQKRTMEPVRKMLHHTPNGGSRNPIEGRHLKEQGVMAGWPDLSLNVPRSGYASLHIEMKYGKGTLTASQHAVLEDLRLYGNAADVCYSADEAIEVITAYMQGNYVQRPLPRPGSYRRPEQDGKGAVNE